jgi:hypothetical protein
MLSVRIAKSGNLSGRRNTNHRCDLENGRQPESLLYKSPGNRTLEVHASAVQRNHEQQGGDAK